MLSYFIRFWLFVTPWTVARQAPLSMGFSSQEYWSGVACPYPANYVYAYVIMEKAMATHSSTLA